MPEQTDVGVGIPADALINYTHLGNRVLQWDSNGAIVYYLF